MTKTTSKSSFSRFSQFFRVFPGKTEPSSLVFPHTPRTHYVCVRVWEKLRLAPPERPKTPLNDTRFSQTKGAQNVTHIQRANRRDRMGTRQRRRYSARVASAVRRQSRHSELRPGQALEMLHILQIVNYKQVPQHRGRPARSHFLKQSEYSVLDFDIPKPIPKDERERQTRIQWAKDFRTIADWLDANCYTTESEES